MTDDKLAGRCIVVVGTASLQRYIFQSNRLKENIGASSLVKYWLEHGLVRAMSMAGTAVDCSAWDAYQREIPDDPVPPDVVDADVQVIYVGGGNAGLLCKSRAIAIKAVKSWSRELLTNAPGLRVAVGYGDVRQSLADAYRVAREDLERCEEALPFGAAMHALPVVRTCSTTGLPASRPNRDADDVESSRWISPSASTKRAEVGSKNRPGRAQLDIAAEFKSVLTPDGLRFALELEELGGYEGESSIAVVHADGNEIGSCLTEIVDKAKGDTDGNAEFLHDLRAFSASTSRLAERALGCTLSYLWTGLPALKDDLSRRHPDVFPLRPIIYGGDDLTFVCDGRLGLDLADCYLRNFAAGTIRVLGEDKPVDACAGVAIVPTKFPFSRAYDFAGELCSLAKAHRRDEGDGEGSWLDFHLVQSGATQAIGTLRHTQYRSLTGDTLHQRPYQVPGNWDDFAAILQQFKSTWPRSRSKNLLQALVQGAAATRRFLESAHWRELKLPSISAGMDANAKKWGWTSVESPKRRTPYFDPLEMIDFYLVSHPKAGSTICGEDDGTEDGQ